MALLLGLLAALLPASVGAHAVLLRGTPSNRETLARAPSQVQLLFSEPLDRAFSTARAVDATGQGIDLRDAHVDPDNDRLLVVSLQPGLPNGVYTVLWRSLSSIDVHPDQGAYRLYVGVPVASEAAVAQSSGVTATPETTLARWWFYAAASLFGGGLAAWKFVFGPVLVGPRESLRAPVRARLRRLVVLGGMLLFVGTLFAAVAQAAAAASLPLVEGFGQPLADLLLRGRFASIWWPRVGLELASLALILFGGLEGLASECALATLPAVLLTSALTSHGAALPQGGLLGIGIDWVHVLGGSAWVGGLISLAVALPILIGSSVAEVGPVVRTLVGRFGRFALAAAILIALSGAMQAALEVGSWAALLSSAYGQLVAAKVVLLAAMLVVAGFNEWRARASSGRAVGVSRGVRAELTVGLIVLAVAALLSGTPPPAPIG